MSCLSWNCRGLENPETVPEFHNLVRLEGPALVFLTETKIGDRRVADLTSRLGFAGCRVVSSVGLSGGLVLFWSTEVEVTIVNASDQHIDATVCRVEI